jgi:polysaccharide chain length determinant protein (PEP-CTERM system associated)
MNHQVEHIIAEIAASWRFRWQGLIVAWIMCVAGWSAILLMPDKYESKAQVYVDSTSILKPLLAGIAVSANTESEADLVRHALLARPNIDKVAKSTGLYARANGPDDVDRLLRALENDITITGDNKISIYTIGYADRDAGKARAVVQALLDTFMRDSVGADRADSQSAQNFLRAQVAEYETRLSASEAKLAAFKKANVGLMPDERGGYFAHMQTELAGLEKIRADLAVAVRQRDALQSKIIGSVPAGSEIPSLPTDSEIQAATSMDSRLQESRKQLDELLLKFTDHHPDVVALKETIASLEKRRATELGRVRATNSSSVAGAGFGIDPVLQNLQIQLNSSDIQVAALQAQYNEAAKRVSQLRQMVTTVPEVEAELTRLNRDYGVTKAQYEALLQRLETANISDKAGQRQEAQFKVLEPPRLPREPIAPLRPVLLAGVLLAALGAGGALAYLLNFMRPVFVDVQGLVKATGLVVAGVVSRATLKAERTDGRWGLDLFRSACSALGVVFLVGAVFSHPLSQLLRTAVRLN